MLKRFSVKGFRSCENVELDSLGKVTALLGRNGSGKTAILRAMAFVGEFATTPELAFEQLRYFLRGSCVFEADVELDRKFYRYHLRLQGEWPLRPLSESLCVLDVSETWLTIFDRQDQTVNISGRSPIQIGSSASCIPAILSLLPASEAVIQEISPISQFFHQFRYYPLDEPSESEDQAGVILKKAYNDWVSQARISGSHSNSFSMRLLYSYIEENERFEEFAKLLGEHGLDLIRHIQILRTPDFKDSSHSPSEESTFLYHLSFQLGSMLGGGGVYRTFGTLSLGTRRVLRVLAHLVLDRNALMLFEHPEDGIHRALLRKLINVMQSYAGPSQVIFSTHSAVALNELNSEDVRFVSIKDGQTQVKAMSPQEMNIAKEYIEDQGTLAEFIETVEE